VGGFLNVSGENSFNGLSIIPTI